MAISVASELHFQNAAGVTTFTTALAHTSGTDLMALVFWRGNSMACTGITYAGVPMTLAVSGNAGGTSDPRVYAAAYKLDDIGSAAGSYVISFNSSYSSMAFVSLDIARTVNARVSVESAGNTALNSGVFLGVTHTRSTANTFTIHAAVGARTTNVITWSPSDSMNEVLDFDLTTNSTMSICVNSLQEVAGGALTRGSTSTQAGKTAAISIALVEAEYTIPANPEHKGLGTQGVTIYKSVGSRGIGSKGVSAIRIT